MNSPIKSHRLLQKKPVAGFTLIEVLVAVAITVAIAAVAYGLFHQTTEAIRKSEGVLDDINEIETVWQVLSTDLNHAIDRAVSGGVTGSSSAAPFIGGDAARDSGQVYEGEYLLRLVRDGWSNPLQQQRSELQRVGYRWYDGQLWRDYWAEKNQPFDEEPLGRRLLLTDLEEIQIRFLPGGASSVVSNDWLDTWPVGGGGQPQNGQQGLATSKPIAMEVTLTLAEVGDVQRIFSFAN